MGFLGVVAENITLELLVNLTLPSYLDEEESLLEKVN